MARFGSPEELGYEEPYPIETLKGQSVIGKILRINFTHRDSLGAVMNLGIDRSTVGDIFWKAGMRGFTAPSGSRPGFVENLTKVKHTNVRCETAAEGMEAPVREPERVSPDHFQANGRTPFLAKLYQLSRNQSLELFRTKRYTSMEGFAKTTAASSKAGYGERKRLRTVPLLRCCRGNQKGRAECRGGSLPLKALRIRGRKQHVSLYIVTVAFLFYFTAFSDGVLNLPMYIYLSEKTGEPGIYPRAFSSLYGSGAIMMLLVSSPMKGNLVGIYIAGCIGATILEYVTGVVMEALFKVCVTGTIPIKIKFQGEMYAWNPRLRGFSRF